MTNKEVINIITDLHDSDKYSVADITEAKRIVINAIEEQKTAHVIVDEDGNIECSNCGSSECWGNYCINCGAKMEVEDE